MTSSSSRPPLTKEFAEKNFHTLIETFKKHDPPTFGRQFQELLNLQKIEFGEGIVGKIAFTVKIPQEMKNGHNIGHGGALSSLLDDVTWLGAYMFTGKYMYSVKLVTEFMNQTPLEEELILEVSVNKLSKNLAFIDATLKHGKTLHIIC